MAIDQALVAFKSAFSKPHTTPNNPLLANEGDNIGVASSTKNIFGDSIPSTPPTGSFYDKDSGEVVEKVRLSLEYIPGTDTPSGRHGFYAKLPSDYETSSSNTLKGTFPYLNNQTLAFTTGTLQIVPESQGGKAYQQVLRDTTGVQIPLLDPREWFAYTFGGILYQETPPGTGADSGNPGFLDCYIYIGRMAEEVISSGSASSASASIAFESQDQELTPSAVRVNFTGSGVSGSVATPPGGDEVTYTIPGIDFRQVLFLRDCGPFEGFSTSSMFHSFSHGTTGTTDFDVSSSIWYTDTSKNQKIFEEEYTNRNSRKQAEKIIYKVYEADGLTVKTTVTDIVTYSGIKELTRTRTVT